MQQIHRKSKLIETYCVLVIDFASIVLSYLLAMFIRFGTIRNADRLSLHYNVCMYMMLFCLLYSVLIDWNRHFFGRGYYTEFVAVLKYDIIMSIAVGCLLFLTKDAENLSRLTFGYFGVFNLIFTYLLHIAFKRYMVNYYKRSNASDKVLVVTDSEYAEKVLKRIRKEKAWNYEITALAIVDRSMVGEKIEGIPVVADKENLYEVSVQTTLDEVFLFLPNMVTQEAKQIIIDFESMGVVCHYSVDALDLDMKGKSVGNFAGYAVITFALQYMDYRRLLVKRAMDIVGGLIGLAVVMVLMPFVALAIKLNSKGPVFFAQTRVGKNGRRFQIYKFRSMYLDAEERKKELESQNEMQGLMFKMDNDPRITPVGKFLRKTSIDELPQFFNVLKGDMSLVGTRPPTEDEFEQYNMHYRRRLSITPGITGMWQVKGRGKTFDFDEVVKMDLEYIDNWSLSLDIKILFQTVFVVLFGIGAK